MSHLVIKYSTLTPSTFEQYDELCTECSTNTIVDSCNKCGDGVCSNDNCCNVYPHYNKSMYIICRSCFQDINSRLYALIDDEKNIPNKSTIRNTIKKSRKLSNGVRAN
jgi:hypothetical protein